MIAVLSLLFLPPSLPLFFPIWNLGFFSFGVVYGNAIQTLHCGRFFPSSDHKNLPFSNTENPTWNTHETVWLAQFFLVRSPFSSSPSLGSTEAN